MESLKGFFRRHGKMSKEAFLAAFPYPFLASPPPKESAPKDPDFLFPGAWVIPLKKKESVSLDARITLGRGAAQDIWIDDDSVSKEHCYFVRSGDTVRVADANSTNGTFLNGHPLIPHEPRPLRPGDKVGIGEKIAFNFFPAGDLYNLLFVKAKKEPS